MINPESGETFPVPPVEIPVDDTITLRPVKLGDSPDMFRLIDRNREHLSQHGDITSVQYPDLARVMGRNAVAYDNIWRFNIWDKDSRANSIDKEFNVGFIKLTQMPEEPLEIGYYLGAEYQGKGYATRAVVALTTFAVAELGRSEIMAKVNKTNEPSLKVLYRAGYRIIGDDPNDKDYFRLTYNTERPEKTYLYPNLAYRADQIEAGEYAVVEGNPDAVDFDPDQLHLVNFINDEGPLPGVYYQGFYRETDEEGIEQDYPVVSFLYNKLDTHGKLEDQERIIIWRGIGYGEHPGHKGQLPTWYLVGPQIGTFDPEHDLIDTPTTCFVIEPKHFSIACVTEGPFGEAILANPSK